MRPVGEEFWHDAGVDRESTDWRGRKYLYCVVAHTPSVDERGEEIVVEEVRCIGKEYYEPRPSPKG